MGLLSFAKDIGHKLFSNEAEAAEKVASHINEDNPGINNLEVQVEDGVATLSGEAESAEALQKAVLMAGNIQGIKVVNDNGVTAPAPMEEVEYYEIKSGDTLWAVAQKYYDDGSKYTRIFEANREVIKDPDKIFVGQKIRIPL